MLGIAWQLDIFISRKKTGTTQHTQNICITFVQHFINVIQMFCVCWECSFTPAAGDSDANNRAAESVSTCR